MVKSLKNIYNLLALRMHNRRFIVIALSLDHGSQRNSFRNLIITQFKKATKEEKKLTRHIN